MTGPEAAVFIATMLSGLIILGGVAWLTDRIGPSDERVFTLCFVGIPSLILYVVGLCMMLEEFT